MGCLFYGKWKKRSKPRRSVLVSDNQVRSGMLSATASPRSVPELYKENAHKLRVFSYSELRQATGNFSKSQKVGEGGFGCVYKGTIVSKRDPDPYNKVVVAIKKLKPDGFQGHKQWVSEVQFLGIVEHPNLVKLIGYSAANSKEGIQRLLVYEYMINRSLDDHLFESAYPALCWECRLQILLGAARGLAYLHEGMEVQVIYRDFKASNVLLDETFTPKLSDFGLAREGPAPDRSHVSTAVLGTYGYAAPDYIRTGHLSSKSDVWSFGVVLYEVLTGRRSLERNRPKSEQDLVMWVKQHMNTDFEMIMDPRLETKYSISQARQIAGLADSCLVYNSKKRPSMSKVVDAMERIVVGNTKTESCNRFGDEGATTEKPKLETLDSAKRRLAHLTKMSEQVEGMSTRKAVILQRNKEP